MKRTKAQLQKQRHRRVRARISGSPQRPRLCVSRSLRGMYVQLIDDVNGKTIASVTSKKDATGDAGERTGKIAVAYQLGQAIAKKAKEANVTAAVFDRSGYRYHGRVQAVADGARDGGMTM